MSTFVQKDQNLLDNQMPNIMSETKEKLQQYPNLENILTNLIQNVASPSFKKEFLEQELNLISTLISGAAIEHHLEPSYYAAYETIVKNALVNDTKKSA